MVSTNAEQAKLDFSDLDDLYKIYSADLIDKKILLENINGMLVDRPQVSLSEVVEVHAISKGLAELLAYITLINTSNKYFINENASEVILFDSLASKYLELPQIIFTK